MGTRTYSRRGVLTRLGRQRAGLEAIDILGRPIPDRVAPVAAVVAPPAVPVEPVIAPEVEAEAQRDAAQATEKTGESLTKYLNDPSTYPPNTYDYFEGDLDNIFGANTPTRSRNNQIMMERLGLDKNNTEHRQIYLALMGISPNAGLQESFPNFGDGGRTSTASRINGATVQAGRSIEDITPTRIVIENQVFKVEDPNNTFPGMGYAMIRKQAWAARRLGEITGKEVEVFTKAVSRDSNESSWVGVHVWPKIGYNFNLNDNPALQQIVQAAGFRSSNTADLMSETLPDGRTGYSMWASMVDTAARNNTFGEVELTGRVRLTDDSAPGLQVLQAAGRRKGLSKVGSQSGDDGFNITPEEDAYLGALWQKFGKKR